PDVSALPADERERRRALGCPPFGHLVRVLVTGRTPTSTVRALDELRARAPESMIGPAVLPRLRGRSGPQLIAKTASPRHVAARLAELLSAAAPAMRAAG